MTDKTLSKDKENSYPCLPKLHLTCRRCLTAHEDTKFWWKKPNLPMVVAKLNHFQREPQDAHLSFSAIAFKVLRVKPELQILLNTPAGCCEHSRCLEKSCLNLEFCWETLMSVYALASLRNQKHSLKQTQPFWHSNRKIKRLFKKHKTIPQRGQEWLHDFSKQILPRRRMNLGCRVPLQPLGMLSWTDSRKLSEHWEGLVPKCKGWISQHERHRITII